MEPSTLLRYGQIIRKHVLPHTIAQLSLSDIEPSHIIGLYADLKAAKQSDSTRKKVHNILHAAFEAALHERTGFLRNPCALQQSAKPKYRPDTKRPFDVIKEAAFLDAVKGDDFEALYMLALDAGMRQGELFALEWADVNWAKSTIEVRQTLKDSKDGLVVGVTKGKQRRAIWVSTSTIDALHAHQKKQMASGGLRKLVFPNQTGGYLRRQNFDRRAFARALEAAQEASNLDFQGHTFHDLRHTMASILLQEGESITRVSQRLGHATAKITLDTYANCLPQDEDRPAARFENRRKTTNPQLNPQTYESTSGT